MLKHWHEIVSEIGLEEVFHRAKYEYCDHWKYHLLQTLPSLLSVVFLQSVVVLNYVVQPDKIYSCGVSTEEHFARGRDEDLFHWVFLAQQIEKLPHGEIIYVQEKLRGKDERFLMWPSKKIISVISEFVYALYKIKSVVNFNITTDTNTRIHLNKIYLTNFIILICNTLRFDEIHIKHVWS